MNPVVLEAGVLSAEFNCSDYFSNCVLVVCKLIIFAMIHDSDCCSNISLYVFSASCVWCSSCTLY